MKKGFFYTLLIILFICLTLSLAINPKKMATDAGYQSDYDSSSSYEHESPSYDNSYSNDRDYNGRDYGITYKKINISYTTIIIVYEIITLSFLIIKELIIPSTFSKRIKILLYGLTPLLTILIAIFINSNLALIIIFLQLYLLNSLKWVSEEEEDHQKKLVLLIIYLFITILMTCIFNNEFVSILLAFLVILEITISRMSLLKLKNNDNDLSIIEGEDPIIPEFNNFGIYGDQRAVNKFYNLFYEVQMAWMDFNYDKLKELCSDELYNSLRRELEELEKKKEKNIMSDFKVNRIAVIEMNNYADKTEVVMMLDVSFYDYIVDKNKHVKRGSSNRKINNTYNLTFQKKYEMLDNCPSCGAKVKSKKNSNCEYCGSILINNNEDFVLSLINKVS